MNSSNSYHLLRDRLLLQEHARRHGSHRSASHTPDVRTAGAGAGATVPAFTVS